ncbi:hypothetical protein [Salipiger mucosus]|uniref:Uncharacterized protein n=1 Tax=Salipiger mucosus DSM 16094 TaxID=1123237 RepID=S9Q9U4_9RHOB|nr:hypothetical protein [Salipiger mucosus]EPX76777.1 hypothetical protein Salmuc_04663 [Salipiger mucosus DSM 16094]
MVFDEAWTSGPEIIRNAIARVTDALHPDEAELKTLSVLLFIRPEAERDPSWTREQINTYFGPGSDHDMHPDVCAHLSRTIQLEIMRLRTRKVGY